MPLQLLSLWIATVGSSLAHLHTPTPTTAALPLAATIGAQLLVGFVASSCLIYRQEARLRARFLHSQRAAACLHGGRLKRQGLPPVSPPHWAT